MTLNTVQCMDCLEGMKQIPDRSVDMILCDLPYGTTQNPWDSVIQLEPLWSQYTRIAKPSAAIVLTSAQPFTSVLVTSNLRMFKYEWIWQKSNVTGFLNAKKQPLRAHESVVVFYQEQPKYNPQGVTACAPVKDNRSERKHNNYGKNSGSYVQTETNYPRSILRVESAQQEGMHPTQKPVALFEYLIRTYTNEGDTVLDNCMGSGTTAIAARNCGRNFLGFEQDPAYFQKIQQRLRKPFMPYLL